jgi:hypothetical protein
MRSIHPVTPTALRAGAGKEIGRTPVHYATGGERPFRLHIEHPDYDPYELYVPGAEVAGHVSLGLTPKGALRDEDAVLALLLDRGPMTQDEIAAAAVAAMPATRTAATVARLMGAGALDEPGRNPSVYDLGEKGIARLRETLGEAAVIARLTRSRRELWRARKQQ